MYYLTYYTINMKKILLSAAILAGLTASAQLNTEGTGYVLDLLDANSQCLINLGVPNNGGQMNGDANTFATGANLTATGYEFVSETGIADLADAKPQWFKLPYIDGEDCSSLFSMDQGVDLTSGLVAIDVSADEEGAQLELFAGGVGEWGPASSTYNTLDGEIDMISTLATANTIETFVFDLATLGGTVWTDWTGKTKIQSVGFRSLTDGATFTVTAVRFGAEVGVSSNEVVVEGFNVYPNPATDALNVKFDANAVTTVELTDLTGKIVATQTAQAGSNLVNFATANVNAGVYFVNVKNVNGSTTQKVVIK
jgi:hypothetical protein